VIQTDVLKRNASVATPVIRKCVRVAGVNFKVTKRKLNGISCGNMNELCEDGKTFPPYVAKSSLIKSYAIAYIRRILKECHQVIIATS